MIARRDDDDRDEGPAEVQETQGRILQILPQHDLWEVRSLWDEPEGDETDATFSHRLACPHVLFRPLWGIALVETVRHVETDGGLVRLKDEEGTRLAPLSDEDLRLQVAEGHEKVGIFTPGHLTTIRCDDPANIGTRTLAWLDRLGRDRFAQLLDFPGNDDLVCLNMAWPDALLFYARRLRTTIPGSCPPDRGGLAKLLEREAAGEIENRDPERPWSAWADCVGCRGKTRPFLWDNLDAEGARCLVCKAPLGPQG